MKIVELIYSVGTGGAERMVVDMCNVLAENKNDEIILLTVCDDSKPVNTLYLPDLSSKVRFVNLHQSRGLTLKGLWGIFHFIWKEKPDVVHGHSMMLTMYLPMLFLKSRFFHTLHSTASHCLGFRFLKQTHGYFYKYRVQAVTISKECSLSFRRMYGIDNDVQIINGRNVQLRADVIPSDMKKSTDGFTFIHVANCLFMKNQERLFRVFSRLQDEGVPFDLFCLGAGYDNYQKLFADNRQIHILGERRDVSPYLSFSDFLVLSSDYEGMPVSIIEGMSLGIVPISTPAGGVVDMIRDGENGYLADGFDDKQLYVKVRQAISEYGKISRSALIDEFENKYSIDICASNYYSLYNK